MKTFTTTLLFLFTCTVAHASNFDEIEIKVIKANKNVYMLQGAGGNIGVLATETGLLLVDDQFAPLAERIESAMKEIANKAGYQEFSEMISFSIKHVSKLLAAGKSEQEILAIGIGEQYKHLSWRFITEEKWLKTLITDLVE